MLLAAFGVALLAVSLSLARSRIAGRRLAFASLMLINVAGFASGRYGIDGAGVVSTLLVTSPILAVIVRRELAKARGRWSGAEE